MTIKKEELTIKLLETLNLSLNDFWTHDELCGQIALLGLKNNIETVRDDTGEVVKGLYHFGQGTTVKDIDEAIVSVDYVNKLMDVIVGPRQIISYNKPKETEEVLAKWPVYDGTMFRLYTWNNKTYMTSKNSLDISGKIFFTKSFGELFYGIIGINPSDIWKKFDENLVYTVSMTSTENCPYKDTKNSARILETWNIKTGELTFIQPNQADDYNYGTVYRVQNGIHVHMTPMFKNISKTLYNVDNKRIRGIVANTGCTSGDARSVYIIMRAILTGSVEHFCNDFPSLAKQFNSILHFIESISRVIYSQCTARIRNPKYNDTFIGAVVQKIGSLKTSSGIYIVYDTLYNINFVQMMCCEYINNSIVKTQENNNE